MPDEPDDPAPLLSEASVGAAVTALAERNAHHVESMTAAERDDAIVHWRELAVTVLAAASATGGSTGGAQAAAGEEPGPGRAVIVLEDVDRDGVTVQASFHPELLEDLGGGEVAGTPAQIAALELLEALGAAAEQE